MSCLYYVVLVVIGGFPNFNGEVFRKKLLNNIICSFAPIDKFSYDRRRKILLQYENPCNPVGAACCISSDNFDTLE